MARIASSPYMNGTIYRRRRLLRSIRLARYDLQCVRMKPQIVPMAVGRMGVVDLPGVRLVVEFDFAPACEALVAQQGLDARPLFGTGGPVCEHLSGPQDTRG